MRLRAAGKLIAAIWLGASLLYGAYALPTVGQLENLVKNYPNLLPDTAGGAFRTDIKIPGVPAQTLKQYAILWDSITPLMPGLITQRDSRFRKIKVVLRSMVLDSDPQKRKIRFQIINDEPELGRNDAKNDHVYPLDRDKQIPEAGIEEYSDIFVPLNRPGKVKFQTFIGNVPSVFGEIPHTISVGSRTIKDSTVYIDIAFSSERLGIKSGKSQFWIIGLRQSRSGSAQIREFDSVLNSWQNAIQANSAGLGMAQNVAFIPSDLRSRNISSCSDILDGLQDCLRCMEQRPPEPRGRQVLIIIVDQSLLRGLDSNSIALDSLRKMINNYKTVCMRRRNYKSLIELRWFPVPDDAYTKTWKEVDEVISSLCDGRRGMSLKVVNDVFTGDVFKRVERQIATYLFSQTFVYDIDWEDKSDGSITAQVHFRLFEPDGWSSGEWCLTKLLGKIEEKYIKVEYIPEDIGASVQKVRIEIDRRYDDERDRDLCQLSYWLTKPTSNPNDEVLRYDLRFMAGPAALNRARGLVDREWSSADSSELLLRDILLLRGKQKFNNPDFYEYPLKYLDSVSSWMEEQPNEYDREPSEIKRFELVSKVWGVADYVMSETAGKPRLLGRVGLSRKRAAERWGQDDYINGLGIALAFIYLLTSVLIALALIGAGREKGRLKRLSELLVGEDKYIMIIGILIFAVGPLLLLIVEIHVLPEIGLGNWGFFAFIMAIIILLMISVALNLVLSNFRSSDRELLSRLIASFLLLLTSLRVIQYASFDWLSFWSPSANGLMGLSILLLAFTTLFLHKDTAG